MTLHLGENVAVQSEDIVCIVGLERELDEDTRSLIDTARSEGRLLESQGLARTAVLCAGARRAGGVSENARIYTSAISAKTLQQRTWAYSVAELAKQDELRRREAAVIAGKEE